METDVKKNYKLAIETAGTFEEVQGIKTAIEIEYGSRLANELCNARLAKLQPEYLDRVLGRA